MLSNKTGMAPARRQSNRLLRVALSPGGCRQKTDSKNARIGACGLSAHFTTLHNTIVHLEFWLLADACDMVLLLFLFSDRFVLLH
jgi:hypothetical protein